VTGRERRAVANFTDAVAAAISGEAMSDQLDHAQVVGYVGSMLAGVADAADLGGDLAEALDMRAEWIRAYVVKVAAGRT
jgi:hypothetical protein